MESRPHNICFALAFVGLLMGPLAVRADGGELMPYAMKECRKLADALARSVPIPKPFATKQEWFRDGELGIKGEQCRISAEGVAKKAEGAKTPLAMADIARAVIGVLEAHGFKGDKQLDRYKRDADGYSAFARRKDRTTCWANLEKADPAKSNNAVRKKKVLAPGGVAKAQEPKPAPTWRLTVDCFTG